MVDRAAIIKDGQVVNVVLSDERTAKVNGWVMSDECRIGDNYVDGAFTSNTNTNTNISIPDRIEIKQFKFALLDADLLDTVTAHVQGLPVNQRKRVTIELENGGDITLEQAKKLLKGVIDDSVIKQLFIDAG